MRCGGAAQRPIQMRRLRRSMRSGNGRLALMESMSVELPVSYMQLMIKVGDGARRASRRDGDQAKGLSSGGTAGGDGGGARRGEPRMRRREALNPCKRPLPTDGAFPHRRRGCRNDDRRGLRRYSAGSIWSALKELVTDRGMVSILPSPLRQARHSPTIHRRGAVIRHDVDSVKRAI